MLYKTQTDILWGGGALLQALLGELGDSFNGKRDGGSGFRQLYALNKAFLNNG